MSTIDISDNDSLLSSDKNSESEIADGICSDVSVPEVSGDEEKDVKLSACGGKITSYFGLPLEYAKKTNHHRDSKLRPSNHEQWLLVPPSHSSNHLGCCFAVAAGSHYLCMLAPLITTAVLKNTLTTRKQCRVQNKRSRLCSRLLKALRLKRVHPV